MKTQVTCPQCGKTVTWNAENPWRPFCSERCKLIDLGDWADERHRIAGEETLPENLDTNSDSH